MTRARRIVKVFTTSTTGEQITVPIQHEYINGMVTKNLQVDVLRVKTGKNHSLIPSPEYLRNWLSSADMVLTILEVPNEESIYLAETIEEYAPSFGVIHGAVLLFSKKMNDITWDYWLNTYLPNYMSSLDFVLLLTENFDTTRIIPSIERCFSSIITMMKGLEVTLLSWGLINLDAADMHAVTRDRSVGVVTEGYGMGARAGEDAVRDALSRMPKNTFSMGDVTGVLINVIGGRNMTLQRAASVIEALKGRVSPGARIIWGATLDDSMNNKIKVGIAVGIPLKHIKVPLGPW